MSRIMPFRAIGSVTKSAWVHKRSDQPDAQLFMALARGAKRLLSDFNPQEPANAAWDSARGNLPDAQLLRVLARRAERRLDDFSPQGYANMAWVH